MRITCVTFDLDDTLWECAPVMNHAEEHFYVWLQESHPRIPDRYSRQQLLEHRTAYFTRYPELHHDLTRLRKEWIRDLAEEADYGDAIVEEAFDVFWRARNDVRVHEEGLEALESLSTQYRVGAITNGNADVDHIGIGRYFDFVVTAAEAGAAKPHPDIFYAALDKAAAPAHQVAHVGDDPERDIVGARAVGMRTIWINPTLQPWPVTGLPDATIATLAELPFVLAAWQLS